MSQWQDECAVDVQKFPWSLQENSVVSFALNTIIVVSLQCGWSVIFFWKIHYFFLLQGRNLETNKQTEMETQNETKNKTEKNGHWQSLNVFIYGGENRVL